MRYEQQIKATFKVRSTSGSEFCCTCPFHNDKGKPNLYVNGNTGLYFCHACGARGKVDKVGAGVPLNALRERLHDVATPPAPTMVQHPESWLDRFDNEHPFWTEEPDGTADPPRGFSPETVKLFRLGYDPMTDLLTIPVRSAKGALLGVIHRQTPRAVKAGVRPKYLHPTGFKMGRMLFGAYLVEGTTVAITEGPLDAVACWDAGIEAVALHGARMTRHQAQIVLRKGVRRVVCMTDNDSAGEAAIMSVREHLPGVQIAVGMYRRSDPKDPGLMTRERRLSMYENALPFHKAMA